MRFLGRHALLIHLVMAGLPALLHAVEPAPFIDPQHLDHLKFRPIGPAVQGGRVTSIAVEPGRPRVFYVGTASGNLWKTENYGTTFQPLFERQGSASIGAVAVSPSHPHVLWVGTGEANNRQSSPWGDGVYRSVDSGATWRRAGLSETRHIGAIALHPGNPAVAYVAAVGHLWGPNPERGVYRTRDAGMSWEKVLFADDDTGAIDIAISPEDPNTLFAALYQRRRTPFGFNGGGPGSGIYRSRDGGDSWVELREGLPEGVKGRIGIAIAPSDPSRVYAIVEAVDGGLFRSDDGGDAWRRVSERNPRPMYFSKIRVAPGDPARVWMLAVRLHRSDDGGRSFTNNSAEGVHPDHHALWIDPSDTQRMLLGGDGGLSMSFDGGRTWRMVDNLPISQFYKIGVDFQRPYRVYGGMQDNGTWMGPSAMRDSRGIRNADWLNLNGGDGFYAEVDPLRPGLVYVESQRGRLMRVDAESGERQWIQPQPQNGGEALRWNWNTPILLSRHDGRVLYAGAQRVLRSSDRGRSWESISRDLTKGRDRRRMEIMGSEMPWLLSQNDGIAFYGTLTALAESPLDPRLLYAGSDDGNLQVTRDGGALWRNITPAPPALPADTHVSRIAASRHSPSRVYVSFDGHRGDDYRPYIFVSEDFGESWRLIVAGLPRSPVNVVAEDPRNPRLLYAGNELGAYFSLDRGGGWQRLGANLPTVPVDDLLVHPRDNDLILGTHGRGIWILDNVAPLQEWERAREAAVHLFNPRPAEIYHLRHPQAWTGHAEFAAPNPPYGTEIRFRLSEADPEARLTVLDALAREVRTFRLDAKAGLSSVLWDLRGAPPAAEFLSRRLRGRARAAQVPPGRFRIRLEALGEIVERRLDVRLDPGIEATPEDLAQRQQALSMLEASAEPLPDAARAVERYRGLLGKLEEDLSYDPRYLEARRDLRRARSELHRQRRSLPRLYASIDGSWAAPTETQRSLIRQSFDRMDEIVGIVNALRSTRLPELFRRAGKPLPNLGSVLSSPARPVEEALPLGESDSRR